MAMPLRSLIVAALLAGALSAPAGAKDGARAGVAKRLFLWKATSKTGTVYLLGSIHVGDRNFYPLPDEVENAFAESKDLVVEVDLTKVGADAVQGALMTKGTYENGGSVSDNLPKPMVQKLRNYFDRKGVPLEALEQFRPWALAVTITQLEMESLGYQASQGIDKHFMDKAGDRKIVELESAGEQINLLSGLSDEQQAAFLASTLDTAEQTKELMGKTVTMWKTGDAGGMDKLLLRDPLKERPELKPVFARLIDERNEKMATKIAALEGEGPHFVVVGAGHLIGAKGVVKLLEKKGYRVEQVSRAAGGAKAGTGAKAAGEKTKPTKAGEPGEPEGKAPAKKGYAPAGSWDK
jgi:uncharacterized protein YbaP (TraB family)